MIEVARGASEDSEESLRGSVTFSDRFRAEQRELVHLYDEISALNVNFEPQMLAAMAAPEARVEMAELHGFRVPSLMIAAEHDRLFPAEVLREVAARGPAAGTGRMMAS